MNDKEFDIERMLARSQLLLSVLVILGYFVLLILAGFGKMDGTYAKELTPLIGIVIYYWFQRQRPHSEVDGTNGNGTNPTNGAPTK